MNKRPPAHTLTFDSTFVMHVAMCWVIVIVVQPLIKSLIGTSPLFLVAGSICHFFAVLHLLS